MNISTHQLYQYWQNQILNQLGLVRWAGFDTEVIDLNMAEIEQSLDFTPTIIFDKPNQPDDNHVGNNTEAISAFDVPIYLDKLNGDLDNKDTLNQEATKNSNLINYIDKIHLQMAVFEKWIIITDLAILQDDIAQKLLWQNLLKYLHLTPYDFTFPIVQENILYGLNHSAPQMCTDTLALAFFKGKICALTQDKNRQIGALTTLPEALNQKTIHLFPTLEMMLSDFQQKRVFWHQLKDIFNQNKE